MTNVLPNKLIDEYVEKRLITKRKHPDYPIYILNYTNDVQHGWLWDDVTKLCRGLVVDEDGVIVARPFEKFFNYGELKPEEISELMKHPYDIYEKLDGSLVVYFKWNDECVVASRGSFESDQALWASELLKDKYTFFDPGEYTYLFELIHPQNRIVVDYGEAATLNYIGAIETKTGNDMWAKPYSLLSGIFPCATRENYQSIEECVEWKENSEYDNNEGYVLRFYDEKTGFAVGRMKIKHDMYMKIHHVLHDMNLHKVWKLLKNHVDIEVLLGGLPEDVKKTFLEKHDELIGEYNFVHKNSENIMKSIPHFETRKEFALHVKDKFENYSPLLFNLYSTDEIIWKMIEPNGE